MENRFLLTMFMVLPAITEANPISDWWLTEDGVSVVSIEPCAKSANKMCGYLIKFDSSGDSGLDRELCQLPILGDLTPDGGALKDGWIFNPITEKLYNVVVGLSDESATI